MKKLGKKTRQYIRKGDGYLKIAYRALRGDYSIGHISNVDKGLRQNERIKKAIAKAKAKKELAYGSTSLLAQTG